MNSFPGWRFLEEGGNSPMGYEEDSNADINEDDKKQKKPKLFFGLEMSDGVVYTVVVILTLIFIWQVSIVLQALN